MNLHKHARLTPHGRALLVQRIYHGLRVEEAAQAAGVSVRTAYKWLRRFREEGEAGLLDRSSRPQRCPHATPDTVVERLIEHRRSRKTYRQIAGEVGVAVSTVARRLRRAGFHRLAELAPAPPVVRYEYPMARAGNSSTWPSTMPAASPSAACILTSVVAVLAKPCARRCATTAA